ncbi:isochorismate synthase [Arthrobacter sp. Hiyo4]|nr:isochorismate synthase [Arthrobacter sp. Hiyo4]
MTSTFRTLTVPLDGTTSAGGLPQFLVRDDVLCWTRREAGLVGFGEIARFTATGPERFLEADIWWRHLVLEADITDSVELPGTGPVAFGSFAFSKKSTHVSRLIVPEIVVGVRDGRYWLTQLTVDDGELTEAGALAALAGWLSGGSTPGDVPPVVRPAPSFILCRPPTEPPCTPARSASKTGWPPWPPAWRRSGPERWRNWCWHGTSWPRCRRA